MVDAEEGALRAIHTEDDETETDLLVLCGFELLAKAAESYKKNGKLSKEENLNLHWVFGPAVQGAFELIDNDCVHAFETETDRRLVRVSGSSGDLYWIPPGSNDCQCVAYQWKKDFCKHTIAAQFYLAIMPADDFYVATDEQLDRLYRTIISKND